jgi:hypothetical protein
VLIAQLLNSSGPAALDSSALRAQNVLPACVSRHSQNLKLLLPADVRSCYKERVQGTNSPKLGGNIDKHGKALEGTACPASAKVDLCTVSIVVV